ncbi:Clr2 domain protein, putative [Rhizoctonia solani AG-3 Rhs1AP]|uniref:Clr2 domain protein, putative n=1 Tax=Rhizoctonia solani AG-3 Rhs1AP TaxID=1086054 RepID=X8JI82_9AGAM|nr:Clr2 domain protein, putative [Rhizoctonia solani AG-3 Rhs1AP]
MISWAYSDGANTTPSLHHRNPKCSLEEVEPESKAYQKYLEQIGTYIAKNVFGYTDTPYFMAGLPAGYSLYSRETQPQSTGRIRRDLYLYGPKNIEKFRSPNEFTMHAVWLMGGGPRNPCLCQCIRCGPHSSQIEINRCFGLPGQHDARDHHHHH